MFIKFVTADNNHTGHGNCVWETNGGKQQQMFILTISSPLSEDFIYSCS